MTDRTGYTVTEQGGTDAFGRPVQVTWAIIRDSDGMGLGAYASEADVDRVITFDRNLLANAELGHEELRAKAQELDVAGRSKMTKEELKVAVSAAEAVQQ